MENIDSEVRQFATENQLTIWEGIPWGGATIMSPESMKLSAFLTMAKEMGSQVIYLDPDGHNAAFSSNGVLHIFGSAEPGDFIQEALYDEELFTEGDEGNEDDGEFDTDDGLSFPDDTYSIGDSYRDWMTGKEVPEKIRKIVDNLLLDERYDGYRTRKVLAEHVADLDMGDAETVERIGRYIFDNTIGKELNHKSAQIAKDLIEDPDYDPLLRRSQYENFIEERIDNLDPRVLHRVERELNDYAEESGARDRAARQLKKDAELLLNSLPPLELDRFGFFTREAARMNFLAPYLEGQSPHRIERMLREVVNLERDRFAILREQRYATAARRLEAAGMRRTEVTRRLGVSNSVIERLVTSYRQDIELASDDPIVTDLAPEHF